MMKIEKLITNEMAATRSVILTSGHTSKDKMRRLDEDMIRLRAIVTGAEVSGGISESKADSYRDSISDWYYDLQAIIEG